MKYCGNCGHSMEDQVMVCERCNANLALAGTGGPSKTSGLAIGSLVCGLVAFLFPAAVAAVALGHISRAQIRRSGGRLKGSGMAMGGLIMGYMGASILPFLIIAAIVIPNFLRARIAANEASVVGSMRVLNTATHSYLGDYGQFPAELSFLGPPASGRPGSRGADLIDIVLASGQKSGYLFDYNASDTNGDGKADTYEIYAEPITPGTTGQRYFFTDQSGVVRMESDRPATAESPPL